ncbi:MAG: penicillin-binding protein 2 [Myxococcota bacterium]
MASVVLLAFSVVGLRLYGLQVVEGESYRRKSQNNFFQVKRLEHERGEIVDAQGRVLATNRPSVNVYVTPAFLPDARRVIRGLAGEVGVSREEAEEVLAALGKVASEDQSPVLLARGLDEADVARLRARVGVEELPPTAVPVLAYEEREGRVYAAYLDARVFPSTTLVLRTLAEKAKLSDEEFSTLARRVRQARGLERYQDVLVRRDAPPDVEAPLQLDVQLGSLPGVSVRRSSARAYREAALASHVVGYVNEISPEELTARKERGYRLGDSVGRAGIEQAFEDELRGTDGRGTIVVDSKGRSQRSSLASSLQADVGETVAPVPGNRVVLTIHGELQRAAEAAFDGRAGAIVVLEVETGRVLAMTSTPGFDAQRLVGFDGAEERARLQSISERRPWRFRAVQDYFAPGSTFKVVTALAALEAGLVTPRERIHCPGAFTLGKARFRCWQDHGHGSMNLVESLMHSCDVYYYNLGRRLGLDPIAAMGRRLGLGEKTGIELAFESKGIMPDEAWYDAHLPEGYTLGAAINASIGQGAVSTTPLQLAVAYAAIANGGRVLEPRLALRIERWDGQALRTIEPSVRRSLDLPPEALAEVREGLRRVVNQPGGTAYGKRLEAIEVAGKTGTAQVARLGKDRRKSRDADWLLRDHAWFAAFAPFDAPEIVVVVFNEHGGGGSANAAPIAMRVVSAWHELKKRELAAR